MKVSPFDASPWETLDVTGPLADTIRELRDSGQTYQAIADTLNGEQLPTLRGAARWRVSSVQSAAGYKRRATAAPRADLPTLPKRRRRTRAAA